MTTLYFNILFFVKWYSNIMAILNTRNTSEWQSWICWLEQLVGNKYVCDYMYISELNFKSAVKNPKSLWLWVSYSKKSNACLRLKYVDIGRTINAILF